MKLRQSKAKKPPAPYKLSPQAKTSIGLGVISYWIAVIGMCLTIVSAGALIDGYPPSPTLFLGPTIVVLSLWLRGLLIARGQIHEEALIRHRLLDAVFDAGPARSASTSTGAVVSLATESSEKMMAFRIGFISQIIASLTAPVIVIATIGVSVSLKAAMILVLMLPMVPLLLGAFRKIVSRVSSGTQDSRKQLAAAYMESLQSLSTLQLLGAAQRKADELDAAGEKNRRAVMRLLKSNQLILFAMDASFSLLLVATAAWFALHGTLTGQLSAGQGITLLALSILLLEPMDQVGAFFYIGMSGLGSQRGIFGFLRARPAQPSRPAGAQPNNTPTAAAADSATTAAVCVRDLHFHFDQPLFEGINLEIAPGERVAIMGRSGEGKSTLLSLLKGDLIPDSGDITINGLSGDTLRNASASVNQTTWLFSGTIADNLRFARPDATDEQLWAALQSAHIDTEIKAMPHGIDTELGEQGLGLSGGQAQRIALARAIISGRSVMLFDEPTSHVDLRSEREILEAINELGPDITLIMVTHRSSSLEHMDRVIHIDNGQLHEDVKEQA
ncbi:ATP-binding cassette domain-containing protein [Corynebacterium sp. ES2794-CONJ1]|uniref:ABC transporter ATP-binding protein/permease n=1 Tax=Corynebacterium sp. ES2794-CONJ1 TaxID=2980553 RepID=UPI0021D9663E|nr:ATP-binding cassette domain-containing protein [Corynebacterium sp. ES2794-CONJ1]MCU9519734.1 ATP-binding cassette domain-containing protein [Corynebacterium sp. ES2794-CONJ1]